VRVEYTSIQHNTYTCPRSIAGVPSGRALPGRYPVTAHHHRTQKREQERESERLLRTWQNGRRDSRGGWTAHMHSQKHHTCNNVVVVSRLHSISSRLHGNRHCSSKLCNTVFRYLCVRVILLWGWTVHSMYFKSLKGYNPTFEASAKYTCWIVIPWWSLWKIIQHCGDKKKGVQQRQAKTSMWYSRKATCVLHWLSNEQEYYTNLLCTPLLAVRMHSSKIPVTYKHEHDDDRFYYHSWRNNVVIAFGTRSSFLT